MAPPQAHSRNSASNEIEVSIEKAFSDGDKSTWPQDPKYEASNLDNYKKKLAGMWIKESGAQEIGKSYKLDQLPEGFILLERPRPNHPEVRDKYLYGHPSGGFYTSPNRFWPHFQYLMNGGENPCTCEFCVTKGKKPASSRSLMASTPAGPSGASGRRGRKKALENVVVDEEGTPDVFKLMVIDLEKKLTLDQPVTEPDSIDWRAVHPEIIHYLKNIQRQHAFIPRSGELVLFFYNREGELRFDTDSGRYRFYNEKEGKWGEYPKWRAGTVGETPEEPVLIDDILIDTPKRMALNYSGFRVETFPDPNGTDKSYSTQYKYVPMSRIRPLSYWQVFLQGIDRDDYHPSIENALTVMSSFSMVEKFHFRGTWPNASVFCKGVFLGSELLIVGDSIRLMPRSRPIVSSSKVTEVMTIRCITLKLMDCVAEIDDPLLSKRTTVRVIGKVYTLLPENAYREPDSTEGPVPLTDKEVIDAFETVGMAGYGTWYRMNAPNQNIEVSLDQVVGRCYEPDAMELMLETDLLGIDLAGVISGRDFSIANDDRIPEDKDWFWGDFRTETLALESLNGQEVGKYDDIRNPRMWRANLKILDGTATKADLRAAMPRRGVGRPASDPSGENADYSGFAAVGKTSSLVTAALGPTAGANGSSGEDGGVAAAASMSAENSGGQEEYPRALGGVRSARTIEEVDDSEDDEGEYGTESSEGEEEPEPMVLLRGGTEESDGGDYDPDKVRLAKRRRQA
ncbi:hypothetical protein FQN54_005555 [Arachnomyces sp. PD_36]|nr:hypothetical protein FQN54_005555 [Arachnomyces sp. PD_36]